MRSRKPYAWLSASSRLAGGGVRQQAGCAAKPLPATPLPRIGSGVAGKGFLPESRECPGENVLIRYFTPSVRDLGVASRAVAMTSPSPGAGTVHLWGVNTRSLDCARDDTRGWATPYATRCRCHCKRLLAGLDPGGRVLPETDIDAPAGLSSLCWAAVTLIRFRIIVLERHRVQAGNDAGSVPLVEDGATWRILFFQHVPRDQVDA